MSTLKLSFKTTKNIDSIFTYLTDMQKYVSVHPVIYKIENNGNENYLVHETLKLGFIPFSFTYPVILEKNISQKTVVMRAVVFKLTKIEMKFCLTAEDNHTHIEEEINFKSPLPIHKIMMKIFKKQHTQLFLNIEKEPE